MPDLHPRSYLYAPGSNERVLAKVLQRGADAVVLDLEDGVAAARKDEARDRVHEFLTEQAAARTDGPRPQLMVRVNRTPDGWSSDDLAAVVTAATDAISLPKAEDPLAVAAVADALTALERERGLAVGRIGLHLIVESARGVAAAEALAAAPRVLRLGLGAADLAGDLGLAASAGAHHPAFDHVRGRLVLASRLAGIAPPVDAVHLDVADLDGLRDTTRRGHEFGFFGRSVVHPSQVAVVNDVLTPTEDEVAAASRVVAAADDAEAAGAGVVLLDGALVDAPIVARARSVLRLARRTERES